MTLTAHGVGSMIVVSIIEGKNFPVRHDKLLLVEAKFDGEVMSTDPVAHNTFPYFNTELAWEVDKKSLQMHRLQRTVIKLVFYAADTEQTRKESIGYIVLDMRVAQENSQKPTWLPLLNCKYHKEKPEIFINLFLEKENSQTGFCSTRSNTQYGSGKTYTVNDFKSEKRNFSFNSIPRLAQKTPDSSLPQSSNTLKPVLLPESSFYRIGPPELCQENFIFSITLAFAANLNKLAPPPSSLRTPKDFYFYYSLFENGIATGTFANLSNPDFLAERASAKILSSANLLSSYFNQHSNLELFLYCGDIRLALGHIPLGPLASVNTHNINDEPINIDCSVQIYPIEKPCKFANGELAPFVGVCVVLQKVQELVTPDRPKVNAREALSNGAPAPVRRGNPFSRQTSVGSLHNGNEVNGNNIPHKDSSISSNNSRHSYTRAHSQEYETTSDRLNGIQAPSFTVHAQSRNSLTKVQLPASSVGNGQLGNSRNGNGQMGSDSSDNVPHHFCFSLDISNFRATHLEHPVNVFIRYSYPFFGSSASISSHPEIEVYPGMEVNIAHGFCSFNFVTAFSNLKNTFCESPLILEVVHCKKQSSRQEQVIGTARINLFQVLDAGARPQIEDNKQATRRMCTCKIAVMSLDGHEIGDIYAVLTLDDFGPTTTPLCGKDYNKTKAPNLTQLRNSVSSFDVPSMKANGYTQDEFLQAAFELEVWKERQRELFKAELKEKEVQHVKALLNEWKQRDTEREIAIQSNVRECQKLEDKLKQTLHDAVIKEKQLLAKENELTLRVQNLDKQQEQQEKEMKLQLEKMKAEYNDLIRIERANFLDLEDRNKALQRKIRDLEAELQEQRTVTETLRAQLNKPPDIQLKTEVNILRMEKNELRQKLQMMCASKEKYKHQYSQVMTQYSIMQQKMLIMEQLERNRKTEELAMLQQQRLMNEDNPESQKDTQPAKKTVERVTCLPHSDPHSDGNDQDDSPTSQSAPDPAPTSSKVKENEVEDTTKCSSFMKHLISQKEMLLRSGFKEDDQLVQRFNLKLGETKLASS